MGSRNDCPLDGLSQVTGNEAAGAGKSLFHQWEHAPLLHTGISGAISWGFWTVVRLPEAAGTPVILVFQALEGCFLETCKEDSSSKRSPGAQLVMRPAVLTALISVGYSGNGTHKCCPASSKAPAHRAPASTVW